MSMYYGKKLISGVRDVPSMTLAQYNALTNKPKLWIRTDAPDSDRGINADDIEYSNGVSVKKKIDEINTKIRFKGVLPVLALYNGNFLGTLPTDGSKTFTSVTANVQTINAGIYGTIGAIGDNNVSLAVTISNNVVQLTFTPSVTLSQYTEGGKGFVVQINTELILTLS